MTAPPHPSDWFEPLYARAAGDATQVPWAAMGVTPYLHQWLQTAKPQDRSAVVVGCGLGDDAEALAQAGFKVTAFDISPTAIQWAQERFPKSAVTYAVADLFQLPVVWRQAFDLVFEFRTLQALPLEVRHQAIEQTASLVAPQGTLLIATYLRPEEKTEPEGPPWPLTNTELKHFESLGFTVVDRQFYTKRNSRFHQRVQVEYRLP